MNINLHIEQLVLDGLPVTGSQAVLVQEAVESELTRLLGKGNLGHFKNSAAAYSSAPPIQLVPGTKPLGLGYQIAHAVHGALAPGQLSPSGNLSRTGRIVQARHCLAGREQ
jgi:hypothetical protein